MDNKHFQKPRRAENLVVDCKELPKVLNAYIYTPRTKKSSKMCCPQKKKKQILNIRK